MLMDPHPSLFFFILVFYWYTVDGKKWSITTADGFCVGSDRSANCHNQF